MNEVLTRRMFGGLLVLAGRAWGQTTDFVSHRIMRRPYVWQSFEMARKGHDWWSLWLAVEARAPVRVTISRPGAAESLVEALVQPARAKSMGVSSVRDLSAEGPITVRIESAKPFLIGGVDACYVLKRTVIRERNRTEGSLMPDQAFLKEHIQGIMI